MAPGCGFLDILTAHSLAKITCLEEGVFTKLLGYERGSLFNLNRAVLQIFQGELLSDEIIFDPSHYIKKMLYFSIKGSGFPSILYFSTCELGTACC